MTKKEFLKCIWKYSISEKDKTKQAIGFLTAFLSIMSPGKPLLDFSVLPVNAILLFLLNSPRCSIM